MCNILQLAFLFAISECLDSFNKYLLNPLPCAQKSGTQQCPCLQRIYVLEEGTDVDIKQVAVKTKKEMTGDKI